MILWDVIFSVIFRQNLTFVSVIPLNCRWALRLAFKISNLFLKFYIPCFTNLASIPRSMSNSISKIYSLPSDQEIINLLRDQGTLRQIVIKKQKIQKKHLIFTLFLNWVFISETFSIHARDVYLIYLSFLRIQSQVKKTEDCIHSCNLRYKLSW